MKSREKEILTKCLATFKEFLHPQKVILFGSRAKEQSRETSDFDFAIQSKNIKGDIKRKISEKLDEFAGLYNIDVIYLNEIDKSFRNIILNTGKIIYERRT